MELLDNRYTNSIYKEIFDEAKVPFITPDEVSAMISNKEEKLGVTAKIKEGKGLNWNQLNTYMFSEYVERWFLQRNRIYICVL